MTRDDDPADPADRRATLIAKLGAVDARIAAACDAAGRDRSDVVLVAVTKTFPASDVRMLADLGVTDVGESRDQEAAEKVRACADLSLRWHFVGRVQTNKARSVISYADVVHSVDRRRLVTALDKAAAAAERDLDVFVQVSLDGDPTRGGVVEADLSRLADAVADTSRLRLLGLMAIAPLETDPDGRSTGSPSWPTAPGSTIPRRNGCPPECQAISRQPSPPARHTCASAPGSSDTGRCSVMSRSSS